MAERRRMRPLLGTYVEVGVRACDASAAEACLTAAFAIMAQVQQLLSFHSPVSDLSRLNGAPGQTVPCHPLTLRMLRLAKAMMQSSQGRFDCTVGGQLVQCGALPDLGGPTPLARCDASDIVIGHGWARLARPARLTLDGIAKGFAVDLAIDAMRARGAHAAWVNAGGDLRVQGDVALPVSRREADGRLTPLGALREAAIASSRAQNALDPHYPAHIVASNHGRVAAGMWTVMARRAWRADALTKVAANTDAHQRAALIQALGGCLLEPNTTPPMASAQT